MNIASELWKLYGTGSRAAVKTIKAILEHDKQAESHAANEWMARANANLGVCRTCGERTCFGECVVLGATR